MTLAKAEAKHIYSKGVTYNRHLRSSKYVYSTENITLLFLQTLNALAYFVCSTVIDKEKQFYNN